MSGHQGHAGHAEREQREQGQRRALKCASMRGKPCPEPVTHIGSSLHTYCAHCAPIRRRSGYERTRKMRAWERRRLEAGRPLPSYEPGPEPGTAAFRRMLRQAQALRVAELHAQGPSGRCRCGLTPEMTPGEHDAHVGRMVKEALT